MRELAEATFGNRKPQVPQSAIQGLGEAMDALSDLLSRRRRGQIWRDERELKVPLEASHTWIVKFDIAKNEAYRSARCYLQETKKESNKLTVNAKAQAGNADKPAPAQTGTLEKQSVMVAPSGGATQNSSTANPEYGKLQLHSKAKLWSMDGYLTDISGPMKEAVEDSDLTMITNLISRGVDLNLPYGNNGWTPLERAVWIGDKPMVRLLLQGGADPDFESKFHWSPLLVAISKGYLHLARLLISTGADPNKHHTDGWTPLQWAVKNGFVPMVLMLLDRGADPDHESSSYSTPLLRAVAGGHIDIAKLLIGYGADPDKHRGDGWTPLQYAAKKGSEVMVKMLLDEGADPNYESSTHWTPLLRAIQYANLPMARFLIKNGAWVHKRHSDGWTPMQYAAFCGGSGAILKLLLSEAPGQVDYESSTHWTPLLRAVGCGHEQIVRLLIENGANPRRQHGNGYTPLSYAYQKGYEPMIQLLLTYIPDLD